MSSKSSSRSKYSHFGIRFLTSVLKDYFILAFETDENFDIKSWLPFKGKMKLPSQMEVLKLVLFLRDKLVGKIMGSVLEKSTILLLQLFRSIGPRWW